MSRKETGMRMDFEEFSLMVRDLVNDIERDVIAEAEIEAAWGDTGMSVSFRRKQLDPVALAHLLEHPKHIDLTGHDLDTGDKGG